MRLGNILHAVALCTIAVAAAATFTASAKTCTWTAQSGNWSDSAKWADGAVPEDGDSVELVGSGGGGTWFGKLAAGGALTVTGAPVIGLPSDPGTAFRKTLFTYASIDATSAAALAAATFDTSVELPKGLKPRVNVGATSCVLTVTADGTLMIFR